MKDRLIVCKHYIFKGADCKRGIKNVTLSKCKNCSKYCPRKVANAKGETVKEKREKSLNKDYKQYMKEY